MLTKNFARCLPGTRERTQVVIPQWLKDYAAAWRSHGADAVVLFGSRGYGLALPDSDWDVAVVFNGSDKKPSFNLVDLPTQHGVPCNVNPLVEHLHNMRPALVREIDLGVSICGDFGELHRKHSKGKLMAVDRTDVIQHVTYCYIHALRALEVVSTLWSRQGESAPLYRLHNHSVEAESANSAERGVKALCSALGVTYDFSHNLAVLAEKVQKDWQDLVLRMNGSTQQKHTSHYSQGYYESCAESLDRIENTLELVNRIMEEGVFAFHDDEIRELREEIDTNTRGIQLTFKTENIQPDARNLYAKAMNQLDNIKEISSNHVPPTQSSPSNDKNRDFER